MQKDDHQLTRTFQNIEMAIVEAIHLLGPSSEFGDGSARCKDIYNIVKNSSIHIDGQVQQGNIRFTIFSSALCGRRSSLKLFEKISDKERNGSWWKLKMPYEDAINYTLTLHSKSHGKFPELNDSILSPDENDIVASRQEYVRSMFMSFIPLSHIVNELTMENNRLKNVNASLERNVQNARNEAPPELVRNLEHVIALQRDMNEMSQNKNNPSQELIVYHHQYPMFP